jgi:hypothetical protein
MLAGGMILFALVSICLVMSTKEQRAVARQRMKRFEPIAWTILAAEILFILFPWGGGGHR